MGRLYMHPWQEKQGGCKWVKPSLLKRVKGSPGKGPLKRPTKWIRFLRLTMEGLGYSGCHKL